MNKLAQEWDEKYRKSPVMNRVNMIKEQRDFVPIHRPCDRCGDIVELGFLHTKCQQEEQIELLAKHNKPKDVEFIEVEEDCPMDDWDLSSHSTSI